MKKCNGIGCGTSWNCDKCRQNNCEKFVICDECGGECSDEYWELDGRELCCDCAENEYKRSIYW